MLVSTEGLYLSFVESPVGVLDFHLNPYSLIPGNDQPIEVGVKIEADGYLPLKKIVSYTVNMICVSIRIIKIYID